MMTMHPTNTPSTATTTAPAMPFNPHEHPLYTSPLRIGPLETRAVELLEHVQVFGATGSGKTRSFIIPAVRTILAHFGTEPGTKAAACVIDAKADMAGFLRTAAEETGRKDDLRVLTDGGGCWFDLFAQFEGRPEAAAQFLFDVLAQDSRRGGTDDVFWDQNARRLLRAACALSLAGHGPSFGGFHGIRDAMATLTSVVPSAEDPTETSDAESGMGAVLQRIEDGLLAGHLSGAQAEELVAYCRKDIGQNAPRTWGIIANYARGFLAYFADERLTALFQPNSARERLTAERIIDEGLVVVVSLSPLLYQGLEIPFLRAVKQAFTSRVLMRNELRDHSDKPPRLINQERPLVFVMDEFHTTLTPGGTDNEAFFLDRAREFRCMCLLATQGVSAINSRMRDPAVVQHLLNNGRTKVFFSNSCPATLNYFETVVGCRRRPVPTACFEKSIPAACFRLPNHNFIPRRPWSVSSWRTDMQREPVMEGSELRDLPTGRAVVVKKSGPPAVMGFPSQGIAADDRDGIMLQP